MCSPLVKRQRWSTGHWSRGDGLEALTPWIHSLLMIAGRQVDTSGVDRHVRCGCTKSNPCRRWAESESRSSFNLSKLVNAVGRLSVRCATSNRFHPVEKGEGGDLTSFKPPLLTGSLFLWTFLHHTIYVAGVSLQKRTLPG